MRTVLGNAVQQAAPVNESSVLQYVGSDGTITVFTDEPNGVIAMPGVLGLGNIPYQILTQDLPAIDGAALLGVRGTIRDIFVPVFIEADTRVELLAKLTSIANTLDPRYGGGEVQVFQQAGAHSGRRIAALYAGGMEGDDGIDVSGLHWATYGIAFKALNPAWLDVSDVYFRWVVGTDDPFFPLLPVTLTASQIIGNDVPVINIGDEPGYPVWKITGKCNSAVLTNNTTGLSFSVDHVQDASNHMVIDTRPGVKTIVDEDGTNLFTSLGPNPKLWPLIRGANSIALEISGTDASTYVEMSYTPRYKMAA